MRAIPPILPLALAVVWAVVLPACKTERTVIAERKNLDPIREKFAGNFDLATDENGMTTVKSDKRSSFEAKTFRGGETQARTKDFKTKEFNGLKEFKTGEAKLRKTFRTQSSRYQGQASTYDQHWKGADLQARETGKTFKTKGYSTKTAKEDGRSFPTRVAPDARGDTRFHDPALDNIRQAGPGEGGNPTVKDIRDLIGKGTP